MCAVRCYLAYDGVSSACRLLALLVARVLPLQVTPWRSYFYLLQNVKHEHKDKLYQHNLVEQGIDPNALYNVEEEEDGGYGAMTCMLVRRVQECG